MNLYKYTIIGKIMCLRVWDAIQNNQSMTFVDGFYIEYLPNSTHTDGKYCLLIKLCTANLQK